MKNRLKDTPELRAAIDAIDLSMPLMKSLDPKEGDGWTKERAEKAFADYRKFLFLVATGHHAVPTTDIDTAWHRHILDTRAYAADCFRTFGFFLHHFPYFGMRGEQDAKDLQDAFVQTKADWTAVFGEPHPADAQGSLGSAVDCNSCGPDSCSSSGCVNVTCNGHIQAAAKCSGDGPTNPTHCEVGDDDPSENKIAPAAPKATTCDMKACESCYGQIGAQAMDPFVDKLDLETWLKLQAASAQHVSARLWADGPLRTRHAPEGFFLI